MKKAFKQILILFFLTAVLVLPYFAFAQSGSNSKALNKLEEVGSGSVGPYAAADETTVSAILGTVVSVVLTLLGIIFVVLIILSGYQWMTAGGNEDDVKKAKGRITNAIIGLVIVVSAYAIWSFVSARLLQ